VAVLKRFYDARVRLITVQTYEEGSLARTDQYHYNISRQQIIEVRDGSANVERHIVHGTRYIDEIVCREVNEDADTDPLEATDSRYFLHQDATWNVTFLTQGKGEDKGAKVEYYRYDPYGDPHVFIDDQDGNGTGYAQEIFHSSVGNVIGHKGRWHEPATGLIENRARHNNPRLGRWMQRDPLGVIVSAASTRECASGGCGVSTGTSLRTQYVDGPNLYAFGRANPVAGRDPSGLVCQYCPIYFTTCWSACSCAGLVPGATCGPNGEVCVAIISCVFGTRQCCGCQ